MGVTIQQQPPRTASGHWRKGVSGNPGGRPKAGGSKLGLRIDRELAEAAERLIGKSATIGGAADLPVTGLELLQRIYRDPTVDMSLRMEAASRAARFESPSLSASLTATVEAKEAAAASGHLSPAQRRKRIAELLLQAKLPALPAPQPAADGDVIELCFAPSEPPAAAADGAEGA